MFKRLVRSPTMSFLLSKRSSGLSPQSIQRLRELKMEAETRVRSLEARLASLDHSSSEMPKLVAESKRQIQLMLSLDRDIEDAVRNVTHDTLGPAYNSVLRITHMRISAAIHENELGLKIAQIRSKLSHGRSSAILIIRGQQSPGRCAVLIHDLLSRVKDLGRMVGEFPTYESLTANGVQISIQPHAKDSVDTYRVPEIGTESEINERLGWTPAQNTVAKWRRYRSGEYKNERFILSEIKKSSHD